MIEPELSDKLLQTFDTCAIHLKRMEFARSKVEVIIPLTEEKYSLMDEEKISFLDQFIFRFCKKFAKIGLSTTKGGGFNPDFCFAPRIF